MTVMTKVVMTVESMTHHLPMQSESFDEKHEKTQHRIILEKRINGEPLQTFASEVVEEKDKNQNHFPVHF